MPNTNERIAIHDNRSIDVNNIEEFNQNVEDINHDDLKSAENTPILRSMSYPSENNGEINSKHYSSDKKMRSVEHQSLKFNVNETETFCFDGISGNYERGCENESHQGETRDLTSSWDQPGPSRTQVVNKRIRSKSWCGTKSGNSDRANAEIRYLKERLLRTQSHPQPAAIKHFTALQKTTLLSLALVDFMSFCSMSIMAPFFPREANEKGMSEAVSGFVFSFYALVMFITSPMFGKILPNVGAKFLFISGIFMAGSCNILFGFLEYIYDYNSFTTFCFVIRGFEALGASAYSTASYVFVINTFPNNIGSVLGILETFVGLGMSVGPAIGGLLYSIGGFGLPFYVLGVAMVIVIPINIYLLPSENDISIENRSGSIMELIKVPAVIIISLVIVIVSNIWAFLDPTLEPHLRQFDLSVEQVGLIFLLFSGLYGIFSPIWGWLADRINRHWCMMVWGLLLCSVGLLLLGPSPLLPFLKSSLLLNLIGLSIVGIAVALTLLPTFQGVLSSSIEEGGCGNNLATYSVVAGVWSCMYSLGEVIGPTLGGILLKSYGFPICSTVMAGLTLSMALITFLFFATRETSKSSGSSDNDTNGTSETVVSSSDSVSDNSLIKCDIDNEQRPLLSALKKKYSPSDVGYGGTNYGTHSDNASKIKRKDLTTDTRSSTAKLDYEYAYDHNPPVKSKKSVRSNKQHEPNKFYPNYPHGKSIDYDYNRNVKNKKYPAKNYYKDDCGNTIKVLYKKNGSGLPPKFCESLLTKHKKGQSHSRKKIGDLLKYNINKVNYYEQSRKNDCEELILDRNQVTDIRGTVNLTSNGACEV